MATLNEWFDILPTALAAALGSNDIEDLATLHVHTGVLRFNVGDTVAGLTLAADDFTPLFLVGTSEFTSDSALTTNDPNPVNHQVTAGAGAPFSALNALMEAAVAYATSINGHLLIGEHHFAGGDQALFTNGASPNNGVLAIELAFLTPTATLDFNDGIAVRNLNASTPVPGGVTFVSSVDWSNYYLITPYPGASLPQGARLPPLPYLLALLVPPGGGTGGTTESQRPLWPFLAGAMVGLAA